MAPETVKPWWARTYRGLKLLDFDMLRHAGGSLITSSVLLQHKTNTVLFGSLPEPTLYSDNVLYINVMPPLKQLEALVASRGKEYKPNNKWAIPDNILKARNFLRRYVIQKDILTKPLFYSIQEGLDFCLDAFLCKNIDGKLCKKRLSSGMVGVNKTMLVSGSDSERVQP